MARRSAAGAAPPPRLCHGSPAGASPTRSRASAPPAPTAGPAGAVVAGEIEEVDGASVEEVRIVNHSPDPRLDALESATRLCQVGSVKELHEALVDQVRKEFLAEWAALIVNIGPEEEHVGGNGADSHTATVAATAGD